MYEEIGSEHKSDEIYERRFLRVIKLNNYFGCCLSGKVTMFDELINANCWISKRPKFL
jgi:hypothetical protein